MIKWQVNSIQHGTVFQVKRSVNGTDFTTINSFAEPEIKLSESYSFTDAPRPMHRNYTIVSRPKSSGRTLVSWLVKVNNKQPELALITTVQGQSVVTSLQTPEKGIYTIRIMGVNGMLLQKKSVLEQM